MSHDGGTHRSAPEAAPSVPGVITFGAATAGDVMAQRYRLEAHVDTDAAGRQIWRGIDTVLRRPVAIVVRQPGGEAAAGMLTAAVAASRLEHPHIVSVYDAIDEGDRAYLVREWVPGTALRDVLAQAPLDAERATLVTHAVTEAVAALHSAGIVHGNIHPGTTLIADDGRVVVTDPHADGPANAGSDLRAVGGILYACLTGHWPHAEVGRSTLPDGTRDAIGRIVSPRHMRGGVPDHLDEIAAALLDLRNAPPPAAALAAEFARLAAEGSEETGYDDIDGGGPMGFGASEGAGRRRGGKLALGVAVLTAIAIAGAFVGAKILSATSDSRAGTPGDGGISSSAPKGVGNGKQIAIRADQIRIVDPPNGDRTEFSGFQKAVDGNPMTGWATDEYNRANFGGLKPGMGILVNLGATTQVGAVKVSVSQQGASITLRTGTRDPGATTDGDKTIAAEYTTVGQPLEDFSGTNMVLPVPEGQQQVQYLLIWITKLPVNNEGKFVLSVNEITVLAP